MSVGINTCCLMHYKKIAIIGQEIIRKSMDGWNIFCEWKDGSTWWEKSSNLKESNTIQVAQYAVAKGTQYEQAFNLWVHHVLKKSDQIIFHCKIAQCSISVVRRSTMLMPLVRRKKRSPVRCHAGKDRECEKLYPRATSHKMGFSMSFATWCLTLKLRISEEILRIH